MSEQSPEKDAPLATIDEAIAAWEAKGPTSLTVALMAEALYGVRKERRSHLRQRPRNFDRLAICGETVVVKYDPNLTDETGEPRRGMQTWEATNDAAHERPFRQVIWLREWDERVFLHEVLHVLLSKHYPHGRHAYDHSFIEDPQHERAVRTIEDALWDMGWRVLDGVSAVDPAVLDRNAVVPNA